MFKLYNKEAHRLLLLRRYRRVACASMFVANELLRHGVQADVVNLFVQPVGDVQPVSETQLPGDKAKWEVAFVGRMEFPKGVHLLIDALAQTSVPLNVTFAGDGRERATLESLANEKLVSRGIGVHFTGWLDTKEIVARLRTIHLLVIPSIWPEPFGLVGIEAGLFSVPAVAFRLGGIPNWLTDNFNGCLAPGDPPTPTGLVEAIERAVQNPEKYMKLREGARSKAESFSADKHMRKITAMLTEAADTRLPYE